MKGRYVRQERLSWIGREGQERIGKAKVAVIGVGGLGSMSASLLARAGVGEMVLVDRDLVEENNLHRQILYVESDCGPGSMKAIAAAKRLREARSDLKVEGLVEDLGPERAAALAEWCDLILDGTDNFETRYIINEACVKAGVPWIYAGVVADYGSVMAVRPGETPCLTCVFPTPPPAGTLPACVSEGVSGPAVTAIASVQSSLALKLLAGRADLCPGGMFTLDLATLSGRKVPVPRDPNCPCCGGKREG